MQEDERDLLEVLIFDEIEETVGTWLRTIIRRLEKEQRAIRRDQQKQPTSGYETLRGTPLSQKHHPKTGDPCRRRPSAPVFPGHQDPSRSVSSM
jgi:hypothetical protein